MSGARLRLPDKKTTITLGGAKPKLDNVSMRYALFLVLPTTLIVSTNYGARAQGGSPTVGASVGPTLVLVQGDTSKGSTPSCSFISVTQLAPVPIVQGLLSILPGDSPQQVQSEMGFSPDQPYSNGALQWTAAKGGNYVRANVNFRNNGAFKRSFTMAINHQQPNEKQCQWEANAGYR